MNTSISSNPFTKLRDGDSSELPACDRFDAADHLWSQPEIDALTVALAARRPLLVRGEAGCGKSQLARAAAKVLGSAPPRVEVIHPRFEALDLLYRFDAVARLADAQLKGKGGGSRLDPTNRDYVKWGALGEAMVQAAGSDGTDLALQVVLLDEVDKADADLPNSLLEVLGNRSFKIDPIPEAKPIHVPPERMPMIIITTNEERELPAAFVRRCMVLNMNPPASDEALKDWLLKRAQAHRALRDIDPEVAEMAAVQVIEDRRAAVKAGYPKVGLAEFVDLLRALVNLTAGLPSDAARRTRQLEWLQKLNAYALVKNAGQDQRRVPVEPLGRVQPDTGDHTGGKSH